MGYEFSGSNEVELDASPEEIWQAIASGPGIQSWFMGRSEVDPGPGGAMRLYCGPYEPELKIVAWEPGTHVTYQTDTGEDGRFIAYEFLVEGRDQGSTALRMVVSGFLPGDDWEDEYDAMTKGGALYWATLVEYLRHFAGRVATPITGFGPRIDDWDDAFTRLRQTLGLTDQVKAGDQVHSAARDGIGPIDAVVYFVNEHTLGIRTGNAMYRFIRGFFGPIMVGHQIFAEIDEKDTLAAWESWLTTLTGARS